MEFLSLHDRRSPGITLSLSLLALTACLPQSACVASRSGARQYQDENTAVTITVATEPVVLAREVSMLAVNARDYVSLFPLEVNRSGQRRYYLYGYSWSTIDRHEAKGMAASRDGELILQADDRTITLRMSPRELESAGLSALPMPLPAPGARPLLFPTDRATLLFFGTAGILSAQFGAAAEAAAIEQYRQWTVPETRFNAFFERIAPPHAPRPSSR